MKKKILLITAFLALFLVGIISIVTSQTISTSGTKFYKDGEEIWFNGCNTPWDNWNDFGGSYDHAWWDAEFQRLKAAKINMTRVWISCSGEVMPSITSDGTVTGVSTAFWSHVDDLAALASTYEIYVLPTMMSFDHVKNIYTTYQSWRNMLNDQTKVQTYLDNYLIPFVQRYNSNKYFYAIDICNEIEWINEDAAMGQLPVANLQRFVAMCSAAIHNNSSIMATVGSACVKWNSDVIDVNYWSNGNLQAAYSSSAAYLDFWCPHYYNWMYEWFGAPFTLTLSDYGMTSDRPTLFGEGPGKGDSGYTITQMYENTWANGFAGYCSWTSNGVDAAGTLTDFSIATTTFYNNHPFLVDPNFISPTSVSISPSSVTINGIESQQLISTVVPSNANSSVTWSTSDSSIVTVNANGLATGVAVGNATITVTAVLGDETATAPITVANVDVTGVSVSPASGSMYPNSTKQLTASVLPVNAINKNVTWSTSDSDRATVSPNGLVTTTSLIGNVTITVTTEDGLKTAASQIAVIAAPDEIVVYRDAGSIINNIWKNAGTVTELTSGGYEGSKHYKFDYSISGYWGGVALTLPAINVSSYTNLVLAISGPSTSGHTVKVGLNDGTNSSVEYELTRTTSYTLVTIPLSTLKGSTSLDLSNISNIIIGVSQAGVETGTGTLYIDDIFFTLGGAVAVTDVSVSPSSAIINGTNTQQLTATVTPSNATNKSVRWSTGNASVATVNGNGIVTGVAAGTAIITATTNDGDKTATSSITITNVAVTDVSVSPTSATINSVSTQQLYATITPTNAINKNVIWSSSNDLIASVNASGLVTAISVGNVTITATTEDGLKTATSQITITAAPNEIFIYRDAGSIINNIWKSAGTTFTELTSGGYEGSKHYELDYNFTGYWGGVALSFPAKNVSSYTNLVLAINGPSTSGHTVKVGVDDGTNSSVEYELTRTTSYTLVTIPLSALKGSTSLDLTKISNLVIGVSQAGVETGAGTIYLDNIYFSGVVSVVPVTDITAVSPASATLTSVGATQLLAATVLPTNATNQGVIWSSSNNLVATVVNGLVSAVSAGSVTITATTDDGGFTSTSSISVEIETIPVTDVNVSPTSATLTAVGATQQLTPTVLPENATNKNVTWSTSDNTVATVINGLVTAVAEGTATITVTTVDQGKTATSTITVNSTSLRDPENPANAVNGLDYKYYEGSWSLLPDFSSLTPVKTGTVSNFDLSVRNINDYFGFEFTGYVDVPSDGQYTFYTSSDDGSNLYIGTTKVVDNDGLHGVRERSGTIGLKAGKHAIRVGFFEQGGGQELTVSYEGSGISKQSIPTSVLYRDNELKSKTVNSFAENVQELDFKLYPNPTSGDITLKVNNTLDNVTVKVINIKGVVLLIKEIGQGNELTLETSGLSKGMYIVTLLTSDNVVNKRLIVK